MESQLKKWYVEKQKDYHKFIKWILGDKEQVYILYDYFYIVEELHTCFKCRKLTQVIGYGVKNILTSVIQNYMGMRKHGVLKMMKYILLHIFILCQRSC